MITLLGRHKWLFLITLADRQKRNIYIMNQFLKRKTIANKPNEVDTRCDELPQKKTMLHDSSLLTLPFPRASQQEAPRLVAVESSLQTGGFKSGHAAE